MKESKMKKRKILMLFAFFFLAFDFSFILFLVCLKGKLIRKYSKDILLLLLLWFVWRILCHSWIINLPFAILKDGFFFIFFLCWSGKKGGKGGKGMVYFAVNFPSYFLCCCFSHSNIYIFFHFTIYGHQLIMCRAHFLILVCLS